MIVMIDDCGYDCDDYDHYDDGNGSVDDGDVDGSDSDSDDWSFIIESLSFISRGKASIYQVVKDVVNVDFPYSLRKIVNILASATVIGVIFFILV